MQYLSKTHWFLTQQLGIDIRRMLRFPLGVGRYLYHLAVYARINQYKLRIQPCLHDWWGQAGATDSEYFWQDLLVARMIYDAKPNRHIDVGSRLDGFVAHVASYREIDVYDIRPLNWRIPGVRFQRADMMSCFGVQPEIADSVSCLHAIEHFGLGRYGDPINKDGTEIGITNLTMLLKPGGTLYLSCPVGADTVYFNAHRALQPATILAAAERAGLSLRLCKLFNTETKSFDEVHDCSSHTLLGQHSLAIYVFVKNKHST